MEIQFQWNFKHGLCILISDSSEILYTIFSLSKTYFNKVYTDRKILYSDRHLEMLTKTNDFI